MGIILWQTGKWTERGDEWTSSSFIASILSILPDAEDDGTIGRMFQAEDKKEARRIATIMAAKQAGATGDIFVEGRRIASFMEMTREEVYHLHLGYQPRRAWNEEGVEFRLSRWIKGNEFKKLVEESAPYEWEEDPTSRGQKVDVVVR